MTVLHLGLAAVLALPVAAIPYSNPGTQAEHVVPRSSPGRDTIRITDDEGRALSLDRAPKRIVSLVPAATEILFAIGAGGDLVGRTRFDSHPPAVREVPSVGDGIRPSLETILARQPDLVILFAGPDSRATSEALRRVGLPVLALRHNTLQDLNRTIGRLGRATQRETAAERLTREIGEGLARFGRATRDLPRRSVYYDAWWHPPITVGGQSYLDSLITLAGGRNVFGDLASPSPQVSLEAIAARNPEIILYPQHRGSMDRAPIAERPGWEVLQAVREGRVRVFDAEPVVRLGPRVVEAVEALAAALHPETFAGGGSVLEAREEP